MNKLSSQLLGDNWPIRRRVMFLTLIWLGANVEWLIFIGVTSLTVQLAIALVGAGMAIIGSYVFGAVWDDHNKRKWMRLPEPDSDQAPAETQL